MDLPCRNPLFKKVFNLLGILPVSHSAFEDIVKALGTRNTAHFRNTILGLVKKGYLGHSYYEPFLYHSKEHMVGIKP